MGRLPDTELEAPFSARRSQRHAGSRAAGSHAPAQPRLEGLHAASRRVAEMRDTIQGIVDGLVDEALAGAEFDLLATVLEPLPVTVIAELLGIPDEDRHLLRPWSAEICLMYELNPSDEYAQRAARASVEFGDYLAHLSRARRANPGSDLISGLTQVVEEGDRLTEDELVGTCVLAPERRPRGERQWVGQRLVGALPQPGSAGTTTRRSRAAAQCGRGAAQIRHAAPAVRALGAGGFRDLRRPGARRATSSDSCSAPRTATRTSSRIPIGSTWGATRTRTSASGRGSTSAFGAPLARLEMLVAFETILRRMPDLQLLEEPEWKPTYIIRGLKSLRVRA